MKSEFSRRKFIKTSAIATGALAAPMIFTSRKAMAEPVEINMLGWYGTAEPDMVKDFEDQNNVKFVPKYYAGGDNMLAALAQNPPGTFDLIHTDAEYARLLIESELVDELNPADYPMDDLMHDDFRNFPGHWKDGKLFSLITRYGHLGVSYNKEKVTMEEAMSYEIFWDEKLKGKVGHFDWHLPSLGQISLLNGNNDPSPFNIDAAAWAKVQEKVLSLRPQVGGYFDFGGTFAGLKNGEMWAMCGIGDWVTGILERDGAPVTSVVPKEGGVQWTESYSVVATSTKKDLVKKYIEYTASPEGQVKSAQMLGYPGFAVSHGGRKLLNEVDPAEAQRTGQVDGVANDPIALINEGRIHYRDIPTQQSLEDWNDFWSEYKNA
ncbi:MAG: spermidine/putrescine transport system substrate-binding protein [Parasphingorhabdus sp.]|jgi:spermidine/putrescine transport system substrate-binding protein